MGFSAVGHCAADCTSFTHSQGGEQEHLMHHLCPAPLKEVLLSGFGVAASRCSSHLHLSSLELRLSYFSG